MTTGSAPEDREVLLRLFQATGGESWERRDGWGIDDNVGDWFGVTANAESRVVILNLHTNNLCGEIPMELGYLLKLEFLNLSSNQLTGEIPKQLGDLAPLKEIRLWGNKLTGETPKELGNLPALELLNLTNNQLTGGTPKELGQLATLQSLYLQGNILSGEIPKELGDLPAVEWLHLSSNQLTGAIPKELGDLPAVISIDLSSNQLSGGITKELGDLQTLRHLNLRGNYLSEVPLAFLQALRKRDGFDGILHVADNPYLRPPQTVMGLGVDQAISWWKDIQRSGEITSNKLKIVLVGLSEAGKTTIVRNITGTTVPKTLDRTVGIEITDGWKPLGGGPLEVSIWDFAGQADYYASHQIFLTNGSLFLLVVDLRALFMEAAGGLKSGGDRHGRVYRWLEMLHLRVPGAAVALVGTHTDAAEFEEDTATLEKAITLLKQLIARYCRDKELQLEDLAREEDMNTPGSPAPLQEYDTVNPEARLRRQISPLEGHRPLFIHDKVFLTSLRSDSTRELVEWVGKAASHIDCPAGFHFPAVGTSIPRVWADANSAMDSLMAGEAGKRYVTWREAVESFADFMAANGSAISDPEEILLRAMRHREAEGGVLLSLEEDPPRLRESDGMLYLDPTWLIEVVRRLTDHNLVDPDSQGTIRIELDEYRRGLLKKRGEEHNPRPSCEMLWDQHRSYRRSGTLDVTYLRFLWLHRTLSNGLRLNLNRDEFNSVLRTMETLLVLYRVPIVEGTARDLYVVPARLPELGDEQVLEKANMALGDVVVRTTCSFRQSYAPPGVIGRLLAFANARIKEARECWQHGAHLIWTPGSHDVLVYETHSVERSGGNSVVYPGLVLCVKGSSPAARDVLDSLTETVRTLLQDKVHGYPGLCFGGFGDTGVVNVSDLTSDLRKVLENRFERLEALVGKVAGVTSRVLEQFYLAAEKENKYPRLLILKSDINPGPGGVPTYPPRPGPLRTVCPAGSHVVGGAAAAAQGMQRETWNRWIKAMTERRKFRMIFICEHDLTEVRCGPGGDGYRVEDLADWVKACLPLLQVSLYAVRVAVGMVSHVDLPLNDVIASLVMSASTEVLGAMGTNISVPGLTEATPLPNESTGVEVPPQRLQQEGYEALCRFMQGVDSPSRSCCGLRFRCFTCGSTKRNDDAGVSWRDAMVRVRNGKGELVWVKKTNEAAYNEKIKREAETFRTAPNA